MTQIEWDGRPGQREHEDGWHWVQTPWGAEVIRYWYAGLQQWSDGLGTAHPADAWVYLEFCVPPLTRAALAPVRAAYAAEPAPQGALSSGGSERVGLWSALCGLWGAWARLRVVTAGVAVNSRAGRSGAASGGRGGVA